MKARFSKESNESYFNIDQKVAIFNEHIDTDKVPMDGLALYID